MSSGQHLQSNDRYTGGWRYWAGSRRGGEQHVTYILIMPCAHSLMKPHPLTFRSTDVLHHRTRKEGSGTTNIPNSFCCSLGCSRSVVNCSSAVQRLKFSALQHNSKRQWTPLHLSEFSVFGSLYVRTNISVSAEELEKLATDAGKACLSFSDRYPSLATTATGKQLLAFT